jgi:uncharacterized metal-binding protein
VVPSPPDPDLFGTPLIALSNGASIMSDDYDDLPLADACSGCSSAAQLDNDLAVRLDRERLAEMSCIAGVGGDVAPLVETAKSDRPVVAIDGCPLECAKNCLASHDVTPDRHSQLTSEGIAKEYHTDYDEDEAAALRDRLADEVPKLDPV